MEKIYQLLHSILLSQLSTILNNLSWLAFGKNFIDSSLLSLSIKPAIFFKKYNTQFYCIQTKHFL